MPTTKPRMRWNERFILKAHQYAREGMRKREIAAALGIADSTWKFWWKTRPALREAVNSARTSRASSREDYDGSEAGHAGVTWADYVTERLPPDLKVLWDRLQELGGGADVGAFVDQLFRDQGKAARQFLWLHALHVSRFNATDACRKVNISRSTLEGWLAGDEGFRELVAGVTEVKKDFVEGMLWRAVERGDWNAIAFAAERLCADRGYGRHVNVQVSGAVGHYAAEIDLTATLASIPLEARRAEIERFRAARELPPKQVGGEVVDAV